MSGWEFFGRVVAVLLLWAVSVVALLVLRLAIGDDWMLWLYRGVANTAIAVGLWYALVMRRQREAGR